MLNIFRKSWAASRFVAVLLALCAAQASAQPSHNAHIQFVNVADSTQGLSELSQFPAINNQGSVAFVATQGDDQKVFKSEYNRLSEIASTGTKPFTFFTDDVAMNDAGIVSFRSILSTGQRAAGIFTSDGFTTKTIVDSAAQGFPGFGIGTPSINASGTVAFQAFRSGFRSNVVFTGDGGSITPIVDTLTSNFLTFGAAAINASGEIVFEGVQQDRSAGVFIAKPRRDEADSSMPGPVSVIDVFDTNTNPDFFDFGDPVISNAGIVADFAGGGGKVEIFSGNGKGIAARNDPANSHFIDIEHPSINSHGAIAFSAIKADGDQCIFAELSGGSSLITVLHSRDPLFGSTVTAVNVGRFALNDHFRLAFEYELLDGRTGIAMAVLRRDEEDDD